MAIVAGAVVVFVLLSETASLVMLFAARAVFGEYFQAPGEIERFDRLIDSLDNAWLDRFYATTFDAELGWDVRAGYSSEAGTGEWTWRMSYDSVGARRNPMQFSRVLIDTYGNSFTQGAEVDDEDTWQVQLTRMINANVRNFGIGGYGPDQALLKFARHIRKDLIAPITILGIHEENIGRTVNRFRPFYSFDTKQKLGFKPRYLLNSDGLQLLPNPLDRPLRDRDRLKQLVRKAARHDHWYEIELEKVPITPPFTYRLLDLTMWMAEGKGWIANHPLRNTLKILWEDEGTKALLGAIIDRFIELCEANNSQPVVLFYPGLEGAGGEVRITRRAATFIASLRGRYAAERLAVIDASEADFDTARLRMPGGHLTPSANRVIAETVAAALRRLFVAHQASQ